jgi:hypothetical protein
LFALETAAIVHDIGIRPSLEKYKSGEGKYQEREGGQAIRAMLGKLEFEPAVIERVAYLVEHHHAYIGINGPDYQILLEADFLMNIYEEEMARPAIEAAHRNVFRTATGKRFCERLYL